MIPSVYLSFSIVMLHIETQQIKEEGDFSRYMVNYVEWIHKINYVCLFLWWSPRCLNDRFRHLIQCSWEADINYSNQDKCPDWWKKQMFLGNYLLLLEIVHQVVKHSQELRWSRFVFIINIFLLCPKYSILPPSKCSFNWIWVIFND